MKRLTCPLRCTRRMWPINRHELTRADDPPACWPAGRSLGPPEKLRTDWACRIDVRTATVPATGRIGQLAASLRRHSIEEG